MLFDIRECFLDDAKDRQLDVGRQPSEPRGFERDRDSGALRITVQARAKGCLQTGILKHGRMKQIGKVSEISNRLLNGILELDWGGLVVRHPRGGCEPLSNVIEQTFRYVPPLVVLRAENKPGEASCRPFGSATFIRRCSQQEC